MRTSPAAPSPARPSRAVAALVAGAAVLLAACSTAGERALPPGGTVAGAGSVPGSSAIGGGGATDPAGASDPSGSAGSTEGAQGFRRDIGVDPRAFYDSYDGSSADVATSGGSSVNQSQSAPAMASTTLLSTSAPTTMTVPGGGGSGGGGGSAGGGVAAGGGLPATGPSSGEVGILEDNTFVGSPKNTDQITAQDAVSTFGLDVDTGSFTVGRTWVEKGFRPEPASVRTEEWVNYPDYDYADAATALAATIDAAPSPFTPGRQLLRVGVQAKRPSGPRLPANIVLVVDTSGSMNIRDRLGLVKSSLALLAQRLPDGDTISIVSYARGSSVVLEPTPIEQTAAVLEGIRRLHSEGSTNLEAGVHTGYELARKAFKPNGINRVILASDGVANQGVTDEQALASFIQQQAGDGIQLVTAGYGMGNLNDHLMEQIADKGDGFYTYIDSYEEAEEVFGRKIDATIETVAIDAKAQVHFDPAGVAKWRQYGYENRAIADSDFTNDKVDAGEVGAGHDVTVVYEVELVPGAAPEQVLATVDLRWKAPRTLEVQTSQATLVAKDVRPDWASAPVTLRVAGAVAGAAEALRTVPATPASEQVLLTAATELEAAAVAARGPLKAGASSAAGVVRKAIGLRVSGAGTTR